MVEVLVFSGASILHIYGWTVKVHFSVECIKLMISAFESLAFHSLSTRDWRFPQPIEMLTLRTMVGGLLLTVEMYCTSLAVETSVHYLQTNTTSDILMYEWTLCMTLLTSG